MARYDAAKTQCDDFGPTAVVRGHLPFVFGSQELRDKIKDEFETVGFIFDFTS